MLLRGPSVYAAEPSLAPTLPLVQAIQRKKAILDFSGFAFADDQKVPALPAALCLLRSACLCISRCCCRCACYPCLLRLPMVSCRGRWA
jgi:hypothetical protein